ncbi:MAG: GntR family transcriptional regulator [Rubrivivax sp.]|nr:GntR family transcriptional regulator [Rubrivivax sp.]
MNRSLNHSARAADAVVRALEQRILEGSLKPGDKLPAEREFAQAFGVSRPTLRQALQTLAAKGLLDTRHGGGTFVTDRLLAPFVDPWQQMLAGNPLLHRDLLEFRQMLERQAAALAADRATDADLAALDQAYAELDHAYQHDDLDACIAADVAFHQAVAEASHNAMVAHLTASLMRLIHDHVTTNLAYLHARPQRWALLRAQHQAIWESVRERRPERAAEAAAGHIEFVRLSMDDNAMAEERRQAALRRWSERAR